MLSNKLVIEIYLQLLFIKLKKVPIQTIILEKNHFMKRIKLTYFMIYLKNSEEIYI